MSTKKIVHPWIQKVNFKILRLYMLAVASNLQFIYKQLLFLCKKYKIQKVPQQQQQYDFYKC